MILSESYFPSRWVKAMSDEKDCFVGILGGLYVDSRKPLGAYALSWMCFGPPSI